MPKAWWKGPKNPPKHKPRHAPIPEAPVLYPGVYRERGQYDIQDARKEAYRKAWERLVRPYKTYVDSPKMRGGRARGMTSPRSIAIQRKQIRALQMKEAGMTYEQIAAELGYKNHAGARKAVLSQLQRARIEAAGDYLTMELNRIDRVWMLNYRDAINANIPPGQRYKATEICIKLMQERSKLLGLYAPEARDVTIRKDDMQDVEETRRILMEQFEAIGRRQREPDAAALPPPALPVIDAGQDIVRMIDERPDPLG